MMPIKDIWIYSTFKHMQTLEKVVNIFIIGFGAYQSPNNVLLNV
jgi:hypothetical protein